MKTGRILAFVAWLVAAAAAAGQQPPLADAMREMGVTLAVPAGAERVPLLPQADVVVQEAFAYPGSGWEVRCAFLPASYLARECRGDDVDAYVPLMATGVMACIARGDLYASTTRELPAQSVRREFNADFGLTALVRGGNCDFSRGYAYVVMNVLYRRGSGVVVVYLLYNDPEDLGMNGQPFADAYYCFRFDGEQR